MNTEKKEKKKEREIKKKEMMIDYLWGNTRFFECVRDAFVDYDVYNAQHACLRARMNLASFQSVSLQLLRGPKLPERPPSLRMMRDGKRLRSKLSLFADCNGPLQ